MNDNMVERVARAMKQFASQPLANLDSLDPVLVGSLGDAWGYLARAAIEAMREPTRDMEQAGGEYLAGNFPAAEACYRKMIDAALAPDPDKPAKAVGELL